MREAELKIEVKSKAAAPRPKSAKKTVAAPPVKPAQKKKAASPALKEAKKETASPTTQAEVLEELDADESGTVSLNEIISFVKQIAKQHDYKLTKDDLKQVKDVFKMVDTNGSGKIDKAEFEAAMEAATAP